MKLTSAGSTNIAMAPPARTTPENSLIIADQRRVVIGRVSRRRWAPDRSNRSWGPRISRWVMASSPARPLLFVQPKRRRPRWRRGLGGPLRRGRPGRLRIRARRFDRPRLRGRLRRQRTDDLGPRRVRRREKQSGRAADRRADDEAGGTTEPPPRRFSRRSRPKPLELPLRENLTEAVADRALNFAGVVSGRGCGEGRRTNGDFDQEPRRLPFVVLDVQRRIILGEHGGTSSVSESASALMGAHALRGSGANEER